MKVLSKCQFWLKEVSFLGHILLAKRIVIDPSKVQEVLEWKSPTSVMEIRSFLGLPGYYRRFTQRFLQSFEAHDRRPRATPSSLMRKSCSLHHHFRLLGRKKKPKDLLTRALFNSNTHQIDLLGTILMQVKQMTLTLKY